MFFKELLKPGVDELPFVLPSVEGYYLDFKDYRDIIERCLNTEVGFINEENRQRLLKKCSDPKVSHFVGTQTRVMEDDCVYSDLIGFRAMQVRTGS